MQVGKWAVWQDALDLKKSKVFWVKPKNFEVDKQRNLWQRNTEDKKCGKNSGSEDVNYRVNVLPAAVRGPWISVASAWCSCLYTHHHFCQFSSLTHLNLLFMFCYIILKILALPTSDNMSLCFSVDICLMQLLVYTSLFLPIFIANTFQSIIYVLLQNLLDAVACMYTHHHFYQCSLLTHFNL